MFRLSRIMVVGAALSAVVGGAGLASGGVASASTVAALWHMDETSGATMTDASGNGNNGTLHNVTLGAAGKYGKSYTFGGSKAKSYVEVPNSGSLNPGSANITISLWLRTFSLPKSG